MIIKTLKKHTADTLRTFHTILLKVLVSNNDFLLAAQEGKSDLAEALREESGNPIDTGRLISASSLSLFRSMMDVEEKDKRLKKDEMIEHFVMVLSNPELFEGFCIAFSGSDDELEGICELYGCAREYQSLWRDPVYQKRRHYQQTLCRYARAATHLYGVVHVSEFNALLTRYEPSLMREKSGFTRETGVYLDTYFYRPENIGNISLIHLIGNNVPDVYTSLDGMMHHASFAESFRSGLSDLYAFASKRKSENPEKMLEDFFDEQKNNLSRTLFTESRRRPPYLPSRSEFLRYENPLYHEITPAEQALRNFLKQKYAKDIHRTAVADGMEDEELLDEIMEEVYEASTDIGRGGDDVDPTTSITEIMDTLHERGITPDGLDAANELVRHVIPLYNTSRKWVLYGNSPEGLSASSPRFTGTPTIVPGSSHAAQMLAEGKDEIEKMGFYLDLDANATVASFPGINNKQQKVYPNDPCPCGSGKKFKKCCGRM